MKSLNTFQRKAVSVFMDKYGIDAGVQVIALFEQHGSLGKAMLQVKTELSKKGRIKSLNSPNGQEVRDVYKTTL